MTDYTKTVIGPSAFVSSDAERRAFLVRSPDSMLLARTTHDYIFDPAIAAGYSGGAIPSIGAALPAGGLINVANDSPLGIPVGLRGAVTAVAVSGTNPLVADDGEGGVALAPVYSFDMPIIKKAGIADNLVGRPAAEGFLDFLWICWFKASDYKSAGLLGYGSPGIGPVWGASFSNSGAGAASGFFERMSARAIWPSPLAANTWWQGAAHYRFDTGGNHIYVRTFLNGTETNLGLAATPVSATPTGLSAQSTSGAQSTLFGDWGGAADPVGMVGRQERIFTGISGHTLDPLEEVQRNWAAVRGRYGL